MQLNGQKPRLLNLNISYSKRDLTPIFNDFGTQDIVQHLYFNKFCTEHETRWTKNNVSKLWSNIFGGGV